MAVSLNPVTPEMQLRRHHGGEDKEKRQPGVILHSSLVMEKRNKTCFNNFLPVLAVLFGHTSIMQFLRTEDSGRRSNTRAEISKCSTHSGVTFVVARCAGQ